MTGIAKKYWKWNIKDDVCSIRLDDSINTLLTNGIITLKDEANREYEGVDGIPWSIYEKNGKVSSIFFRETFFDFIDKDLWECELDDFINKVNSELESVKVDEIGPRLRVVFRGGFVAIAGIEKKDAQQDN